MAVHLDSFAYRPGQRLTCLCTRVFKTERGLRQHLKRPAKVYEDGLEVAITHGRCLTDAAKYITKTLVDRALRYNRFDIKATLDTHDRTKDLPSGTK